MKPFLVSLALLACSFVPITANAAGNAKHARSHSMAGRADSPRMTLRQDMRKLWTDHVVWTRDFIIVALADLPDKQAATDRLMRNQEDIGHAIARYYGDPAGDQLTSLLKQHIAQAGDLVTAAKTGNKDAQEDANRKWQQNAIDIADFLSKANPNWPRATLVDMMQRHLATTTDEVTARLNKDWDGDARAYDAVYDHILKMADALSDGIIAQFPDKFGMPCTMHAAMH